MSKYEQELRIKSVAVSPEHVAVRQAVTISVAVELVDIVPYAVAPYAGTIYAGQEIWLDAEITAQ